jgi:acyl-CoA reductase-like NAD-dependent aldehyde dehydrogenase
MGGQHLEAPTTTTATGFPEGVRSAQKECEQRTIRERVAIIGRLRRRMASSARELAETVPTSLPGALNRSVADTLVSEVLPLIEACRFLERHAERVLRTRRVDRMGGPIWLGGVAGEVERIPWGVVLVLGPANYPLLLAGVQTLQALTAGNAVLWKPAPGTEAPAFALRELLVECGLIPELLTILDSNIKSSNAVIAAGIDHLVLTGSADTGKVVLRQLADTLTPSTMELSGCDAVFVLPGADIEHTVRALTFGLRFNGSFTCMAPRRVFLVGIADQPAEDFETRLTSALTHLAPVRLSQKSLKALFVLIQDARRHGASILLDGLNSEGESSAGPTLIANRNLDLLSTQTDIFAPILTVTCVATVEEALRINDACPFALTASIFGPEKESRSLAARLRVGNVILNDIIIPTADPRIVFGGRGQSGFGVTRGEEGLLAMTTPRTIQSRRWPSRRQYESTAAGDLELFADLTNALHGEGIRKRWRALKGFFRAARK